MRLRHLLLLLPLLLNACATGPTFDTTRVNRSLTPGTAVAKLTSAEGKQVLWGGVIISTTNLKDSTHIEVLGVALLAGLGIGVYPDFATTLKEIVRVDRQFYPEPAMREGYSQLFTIYQELYPDLKPYYQRLAELELSQFWVRQGA